MTTLSLTAREAVDVLARFPAGEAMTAGIHADAVFPGMKPAQWHQVIDVSLHGFFRVTQPLVLPMLRTRWGRILNISSVAALAGNRGQVNYAAAKGALNSATKALSLELASRGVTVNATAPPNASPTPSADSRDQLGPNASARPANAIPAATRSKRRRAWR